ncbi:MAG: putative toxin-antitoxin system toxin component, PIN family [Lentisphaerae bacterium RIFOXYB12_FULL_65_16]|nr:MAG: putative toxin-antitoxin system toxin component, PIN family [Lentisphaerae bacterium RIFOXYA12_64_32]OGV91899.1 MAG: putative toxin-antitoxin system toxin component, PIN family [Lentisphaerae bacterium RIFOXYB12_FULL_65_16]
MRIVLDTNVLVSGLLSPFGTCGEIVRMLTSGVFTPCVDARIMLEYDEVLRRPSFKIDPRRIDRLIAYLESTAEVHAPLPLPVQLPDRDDTPFLEVASVARVDCLGTGNLRHFPAECRGGVRVASPGEFVAFFHQRSV